MFKQIVEYIANKMQSIHKVIKIRVENYGEGPIIYMEVSVIYGFDIKESLKQFREISKREIQKYTSMNVVSIDVVAKNIHIPENEENTKKDRE